MDAFNPLKNWYDSDVIGIDTGITMVMAENARTAFVWETFMENPEAQRGMERAGFKAYERPTGRIEGGCSDLRCRSSVELSHRDFNQARPCGGKTIVISPS